MTIFCFMGFFPPQVQMCVFAADVETSYLYDFSESTGNTHNTQHQKRSAVATPNLKLLVVYIVVFSLQSTVKPRYL